MFQADFFLTYIGNDGHTHHCFWKWWQSLSQQSHIFDTFIRILIKEDAVDGFLRTVQHQNNNVDFVIAKLSGHVLSMKIMVDMLRHEF